MDVNNDLDRKQVRESNIDDNWIQMRQKMKKKDNWYLKGLLERIIVCCLLFIIFYACSYFHVTVAGYTTDKVMSEVQKNTWVDAAKIQWNKTFHNDAEN